jgi:hypothetical protein
MDFSSALEIDFSIQALFKQFKDLNKPWYINLAINDNVYMFGAN